MLQRIVSVQGSSFCDVIPWRTKEISATVWASCRRYRQGMWLLGSTPMWFGTSLIEAVSVKIKYTVAYSLITRLGLHVTISLFDYVYHYHVSKNMNCPLWNLFLLFLSHRVAGSLACFRLSKLWVSQRHCVPWCFVKHCQVSNKFVAVFSSFLLFNVCKPIRAILWLGRLRKGWPVSTHKRTKIMISCYPWNLYAQDN